MSEAWERFDLQPVPETTGLERAEFDRLYRGMGPVVVRGGARNTVAFERWDSEHLADIAGDALVTVASYQSDRRDYGVITPQPTTLREFLAELGSAGRTEARYLFNNASCVFLRNDEQPGFHLGWAATANAGLAPLAAEFEVPRFVDPERFVVAVIIIGSEENATDLHYDHGGEGKVLVQIRGRKRIVLLPPASAAELRLLTLFTRADTPPREIGSRPSIDVHAAAADDVPRLRGYVTEVGPGDVIYWPPFWFHDLANLDPFTLAAGLMVDEIAIPALLMRHLSHGLYRALLVAAASRAEEDGQAVNTFNGGWDIEASVGGSRIGSLADLFSDVEQQLLSEAGRETAQLWVWNDRLGRR